jgi:hypothetical protein
MPIDSELHPRAEPDDPNRLDDLGLMDDTDPLTFFASNKSHGSTTSTTSSTASALSSESSALSRAHASTFFRLDNKPDTNNAVFEEIYRLGLLNR